MRLRRYYLLANSETPPLCDEVGLGELKLTPNFQKGGGSLAGFLFFVGVI